MAAVVDDMMVIAIPLPTMLSGKVPAMLDTLVGQWAEAHPEASDVVADWTITGDPDEVRAWPLPHVCADCVDGQLKAIEAAQAGTTVGLCRLRYTDAGA